MIETLFQKKVSSFSFHNPDAFCLSSQALKYGGLINTYASMYQSQVAYCSDSNGYWRYERLSDVLNKSHPHGLQALTHPVWWTQEAMSPRTKVLQYINGNGEKLMHDYDEGLKKANRKNF